MRLTPNNVFSPDSRTNSNTLLPGLDTYTTLLQQISVCVHPLRISTPTRPTTSEHVQHRLSEVVEALKRLIDEYDMTDRQKHLTKFANQIETLASVVDAWWVEIEEYLEPYDLDEEYSLWLRTCLLPAIYWQVQTARTKQPEIKMRYREAAEQALAGLHHHSRTPTITTDDLEYWQTLGQNGWSHDSNGHPRQWRGEMAIYLRCIIAVEGFHLTGFRS